MSRPGTSSSGRNLTLTEELEKLEQSITLTLQEIDHNFSKAHRIVTSSILPLVEQYGEHSKNVWEASKFWKQFFEASANVSLSGYEDLAGDDNETTRAEETALDESTSDYNNTTQGDTTVEQSGYEHQHQQRNVEDSLLDDAEMTGSTPRPPSSKSKSIARPQFAGFGSPYEALRRELKGDGGVFKDDEADAVSDAGYNDNDDDDETTELPAKRTRTNTASTRLPDMSMTPRSSSFMLEEPTLHQQQMFDDEQSAMARKPKDLLLHRVLDKNYRLQATPHKGVPVLKPRGRSRSPEKNGHGGGEGTAEDRTRRALWADSPMSSPEMAVPKLRSDLYMSPVRLRRKSGGGYGPRTPGVSVQTPATTKKRDIFAEARGGGDDKGKGKGLALGRRDPDEITWESDEDDDDTGGGLFGGMSPPKTIQFALPASKLMQTPAREASRRIVDDILITAGAAPEDPNEYSPTMVHMNQDILDDTF
ncbi:Uu.00g023770.m01.CDS01 [Anthostomella pinea]|uniref:DASH complex subunit ASK1 n=1 Tax=Anthostomella pinea TaxID=933095 RepID=A0AAI8W057_9PEZI|nr:Uu.00g023770.m01.CDS01 [Anthostomella pinea]